MSDIVASEQITYQQSVYSHPSYVFEPQFPNTFGQPINLNTGQNPVTMNLPPEVFNLAQSMLCYKVFLPRTATAGHFIWRALQGLAEISHIQLYTASGRWLADIDNLQNYLDVVCKKELTLHEFSSLDPSLTSVGCSNTPAGNIPALRNQNMTNATVAAGADYPSSINYDEPGYFSVGQASAPGAAPNPALGDVSYSVQFPLGLIKNSLFSLDKNLYFGQTIYMKLYFGPISKVCYDSTNNVGPTRGAKVPYQEAAVITDLQLMLAVESNQDLRAMTMNKVQSEGGLSLLIPYVQAFKTSGASTSQNVNLQLDQGNGRSLMKVIHAPYNSNEQLETMYDHCNANNILGTTEPPKTQNYYTQLNGKRTQDININCSANINGSPLLDYMSHKKQLKDSILRNSNIYQYNWFHCDDFSDIPSKDNNGDLISGIPMSISPITWSFVGLTMNNINLQHYTWCVFVKAYNDSGSCHSTIKHFLSTI